MHGHRGDDGDDPASWVHGVVRPSGRCKDAKWKMERIKSPGQGFPPNPRQDLPDHDISIVTWKLQWTHPTQEQEEQRLCFE